MKKILAVIMLLIMLFSCSELTEPKESNDWNATVTYGETYTFWDIEIPATSTVEITFSVHSEFDGIYFYDLDDRHMTWYGPYLRNANFNPEYGPESIKVEIIGG